MVDLVGAAELGFVDGFELTERVAVEAEHGVAASGANVIDVAVEAVIAGCGGADRRKTQRAIEPAAAQSFERTIGAAWGLRECVGAQERDEHG